MKTVVCELCREAAVLYCAADSAYLCWKCDAMVHQANFLVARHVRCTLCVKCEGFDGNRVPGVGIWPLVSVCRPCAAESPDDDLVDTFSSSSSLACVSCAESFVVTSQKKKKKKKADFDCRKIKKIASASSLTAITDGDSNFPAGSTVEVTSRGMGKKSRAKLKTTPFAGSRGPSGADAKAEGILVNWCIKLGVAGNFTVRAASQAFSLSLRVFLPFRVALAASFWFSLKLCKDKSASTCQNLKRLEQISGVPAKLIVAAQAKLVRVVRERKANASDQEEGWAECSV